MNLILRENWNERTNAIRTLLLCFLPTSKSFPASDKQLSNQSVGVLFPRINLKYLKKKQNSYWPILDPVPIPRLAILAAGGVLWLAWPSIPVYTCIFSIMTNSAPSQSLKFACFHNITYLAFLPKCLIWS